MRSKRVYKVSVQTSNAIGGEGLILNTNPQNKPGFVVDYLIVRNKITWTGGTPSGTLGVATLGGTRFDLDWNKTGQKAINNVTWPALDLFAARARRPSVRAFDVLTDQAVAASGSFHFDQIIPMRRQLGFKPGDYCVQLDEIGQLEITTPDLSSVAGTGTGFSWTSTLFAVGYDGKPGEYKAGVHWRLDERTGDTGLTVEINTGSRPLRQLFGYSADTSTSPISGETSPTIQLDAEVKQQWIGANAAELSYLQGNLLDSDDYSAFVVAAGYSNVLVADYLPADLDQKISDLPSPKIVTIEFAARMVDPTDARYVIETLYPSQSPAGLAARIPGVAKLSAGEIRASLVRPGIADADPALAAILPATMTIGG